MTYKRRQAVAAPPGGGAPASAPFITSATDPALTAERVLTNTATVTWDFTIPGQALATAVAPTPQNTFLNIAVATQPTIVADTSTDTLTVVAGPNITITTNAITDTLTIEAAGGGAATNSSQDALSVTLSAAQSMTSAIVTKITYNVENLDSAGSYDPVTNYRHTPLVAGYYLYTNYAQFNALPAQSAFDARIYKNIVTLVSQTPGGNMAAVTAFNLGVITQALVFMNGSTDFVEFFAQQSSGVAVNLSSGSQASGIFIRS